MEIVQPKRIRSGLNFPRLVCVVTFWAVFAVAAAQTQALSPGTKRPVKKGPVGMEFIEVPPGDVMMGCSAGDSECFNEERPAHRVRITKGFEIGRYEVTQAQWQSVMGTNPSYFRGETLPVDKVSWKDAQEFLKRINAMQDGYRYRLPTEAEWEYAARAGETGRYPGGALDEIAWHSTNALAQTHPVGQKSPNAWGLYDMIGNVAELVEDWYADYSGGDQSDPTGPRSGQYRIFRGGSADRGPNYDRYSRVSQRQRWPPDANGNGFGGIRCVRQNTP